MATNANETQIRKLIENWAQAVRDVDMDRILAHHADDVLMFDVPPPLQCKGIKAYKETWDLFFRFNSGGEGSIDLEELNITPARMLPSPPPS
jgi:ketosteroid isomerase-like protein